MQSGPSISIERSLQREQGIVMVADHDQDLSSAMLVTFDKMDIATKSMEVPETALISTKK